jgi:uncharacterized membrane protein YkvI
VELLNNLESDLFFPVAIVGLALLYTAAGIVILQSRALPRWLAWVSCVLAVVVLVPPAAIISFFGMPIWVLIVCGLLLRLPARAAHERAAKAVAAAHPAPATLVEAERAPAGVEVKPASTVQHDRHH